MVDGRLRVKDVWSYIPVVIGVFIAVFLRRGEFFELMLEF